MKLVGSTTSKINENENGKNDPNLEVTEVALEHCNVVNNNKSEIQESCIHLFLINRLVNF